MKFLILFISVLFVGCENVENYNDLDIKNMVSNVRKICIEGHVYYSTPSYHQGGIAPKLTDDGKPVDCKDEPGTEKLFRFPF